MEEGSGSGIQEFAYAPDGAKLAVMNGQTLVRADVPLLGGSEAVYNGSGVMYYRHADLLGSSRLATTPAGGLHAETAYAPYGEPIVTAGTPDRSFTGKKQDIASGQPGTDPFGSYDFPAREYSPTESRWWSPDPAGLPAANLKSPQSFNRYAYTMGTPLIFRDPSGLYPCVAKAQQPDQTAQASGEFGPYATDTDGASDQEGDDCGTGGSQECYLDGGPIDCGLMWELGTAGDGNFGSSGSDAVLADLQLPVERLYGRSQFDRPKWESAKVDLSAARQMQQRSEYGGLRGERICRI